MTPVCTKRNELPRDIFRKISSLWALNVISIHCQRQIFDHNWQLIMRILVDCTDNFEGRECYDYQTEHQALRAWIKKQFLVQWRFSAPRLLFSSTQISWRRVERRLIFCFRMLCSTRLINHKGMRGVLNGILELRRSSLCLMPTLWQKSTWSRLQFVAEHQDRTLRLVWSIPSPNLSPSRAYCQKTCTTIC